jgi:hypothetical protein
VSNNSGNSITSLDLRQTGDSLEAVDNNGRLWRGNLGEVQNGSSSFELNGQTTAGREGTFSGTLSSSGGGSSGSVSNAQGTMQGTYIESDRYSTFFATATIPAARAETMAGVEADRCLFHLPHHKPSPQRAVKLPLRPAAVAVPTPGADPARPWATSTLRVVLP